MLTLQIYNVCNTDVTRPDEKRQIYRHQSIILNNSQVHVWTRILANLPSIGPFSHKVCLERLC